MGERDHDDATRGERKPDGGTVTRSTQVQGETDYLDSEVNLLQPSTPFMRDHLRVIWVGFIAWVLIVFGPVTLTWLAPGAMTVQIPGLGFPLHYFLVAVGAPGGSLVLAVWYARKRDQLDEKYGIEHSTPEGPPGGAGEGESEGEETAATDGGTAE